jgi:hypothetical protein
MHEKMRRDQNQEEGNIEVANPPASPEKPSNEDLDAER